MNEFYIRNVIEAALLAAGKPLQLAEIGQLFDENSRPKVDDLRAALDVLAADYSGRGIEVKETAAGFRIQVRREFSSEISRLWPERPAKYSRALLETLALIAYRQPITRAEIEAVRGVAVNPNIIKTVIERNWVRVVGHRDVPGRPELLGTTREFLDYFGLRSLDELPPLAELKAMGDYNLQLELPNGVTPDGEPKLIEGESGSAPVAALLTSDAAANADDASTDANAAGPDHTDTSGAGDVAHDAGANTDIVDDPVAHTTADSHGVEDSHGAAAHDHSASDVVAHATADANGVDDAHDADVHGRSASAAAAHANNDPNSAEGRHDAAHDDGARDVVAHTAADFNGVGGSHDAGSHDYIASDAAAHVAADPNGAAGSHGTADSDHGAAERAHDVTANSASTTAHTNAAADEDFDAEAERTLAAGDSAKHSSAESDDADTSVTSGSGESSDALDDGADDDADDDELSADGHGSRELVAAPPDLDD